ncbi:hypothetical protein AB4Y43_01100 [Paraburkholderia sp. BR10872]|uniref:hypothetical protein n=1 Tax=Paraburkholderia sp. BR10872 TaxID=3236989 RepID=UPI0034D2AF48
MTNEFTADDMRFKKIRAIHMGVCIGSAAALLVLLALEEIPGFLNLIWHALGVK